MSAGLKRKIGSIYQEYPKQFWLVMGASFIDRIGGALIFPFFALYLTAKFDVGLTEVGYVFALVMGVGIFGSIIGGALTDQIGRKKMILFGLVISAMTSLSLTVVNDFNMIYLIGAFVGFFSSIGGPAQSAIIADILPEEQHTEGYGLWRVIANLAVMIGPILGSFFLAMSGFELRGFTVDGYVMLFVVDAITSIITAIILARLLEESHPSMQATEEKDANNAEIEDTAPAQPKSIGYMPIFRDYAYLAFVLMTALMVLVYNQMNNTLPVYLRDEHGIHPWKFGIILSMNAGMVVLLQFWFSRQMRGRPQYIMLALGTFLYAIGFGMYGFVSSYALFIVAMIIITVGEMITAPIGQAIAAKMAPADMRGRYMAIYGFSWAIPSAFGLILAGIVTEEMGGDWVWHFSIILSVIAALGFLVLHQRIGGVLEDDEEEEPAREPELDIGEIPVLA